VNNVGRTILLNPVFINIATTSSFLAVYHDNYFKYFMFGKYNGFVSKVRVSACIYLYVETTAYKFRIYSMITMKELAK
jgi:hypothetical protein